ncbi:MAG TPA: sulfotransferase [Pyrinomonadaceae bacterium]
MSKFWRRMHHVSRSGDLSTSRPYPMPVIVGAPRSGTTLLRFMLDTHSELAIPPETGFLTLGAQLAGNGDMLRERFFRAVVNHPNSAPSWPDFEVPEETFWQALTEITPFTVSEGYRAFYRLYAARMAKPRWGDKTPIYCLSLDAIRRVLPEVRFIHIIRDGRDVALSLRKMWFSPGWDIETQAAYWRKCVLAARRAGLGRRDYLEVRYEDLILNTREILDRVCDHVGLSFECTMLSYYTQTPERLREHKGRSGADGTPLLTREERFRQQQRTTAPPDSGRVFAWKGAMSADERMRFQLVAGDLLKELGYET